MMPDSQFHIRSANKDDLAAIIVLLRQLWPSREINDITFEHAFLESFNIPGHHIRLACRDRKVIGMCSMFIRNNLKVNGPLANVDELVVDSAERGSGAGGWLLQDAEEIARAQGCTALGLESSFHREDAHAFYERKGYRKTGFYIIKSL